MQPKCGANDPQRGSCKAVRPDFIDNAELKMTTFRAIRACSTHFGGLGRRAERAAVVKGVAMKVVIVECPAKAKTINKYLGADYKVLASYGHVRDLPAKDGSVDPDAGLRMSGRSTPRPPSGSTISPRR